MEQGILNNEVESRGCASLGLRNVSSPRETILDVRSSIERGRCTSLGLRTYRPPRETILDVKILCLLFLFSCCRKKDVVQDEPVSG